MTGRHADNGRPHGPNNTPTPHAPQADEAAEHALIGSSLYSKTALRVLATTTTPDDYYRPLHQHIATALTDAYQQGWDATAITVADWLKTRGLAQPLGDNPVGQLLSYTADPSPPSIAASYARIIRDLATRRRLQGLAAELAAVLTNNGDYGPIANEIANTLNPTPAADTSRYIDGATWILDRPAGIPAIWGADDQVLWSEGEPLIIVGPTGVGKTTLVQQIVLAHIGLRDPTVLGFPVARARGRVLYLACDRPKQIARSFRRALNENDRAALAERLTIWQGPPPQDFAKHPRSIIEMAQTVGATTVFIDSLKDVASKLSDDETGSGLNRCIQNAITAEIEIVSLHHQKKSQQGIKPKTIDDMYGSVWIPNGSGSVILLWGTAGDLAIELTHLKQPATPIGPLELIHDHDTATTTISRGPIDALHILRHTPTGITSVQLAQLGTPEGPPDRHAVQRARRNLGRLVKLGLAHLEPGGRDTSGQQIADRYHAVDQDHDDPEPADTDESDEWEQF